MISKNRGRPVAETEPVLVRMHTDVIKRIDELRREAPDLPSRPEVVRRLVEKALVNGFDATQPD